MTQTQTYSEVSSINKSFNIVIITIILVFALACNNHHALEILNNHHAIFWIPPIPRKRCPVGTRMLCTQLESTDQVWRSTAVVSWVWLWARELGQSSRCSPGGLSGWPSQSVCGHKNIPSQCHPSMVYSTHARTHTHPGEPGYCNGHTVTETQWIDAGQLLK